MHGKSFWTGVCLATISIFIYFKWNMVREFTAHPMPSIRTTLSKINFAAAESPSEDERFTLTDGKAYTLQRDAHVRVARGMVKIAAGTSVTMVNHTDSTASVRLGSETVSIPVSSFREYEPKPLPFLNVAMTETQPTSPSSAPLPFSLTPLTPPSSLSFSSSSPGETSPQKESASLPPITTQTFANYLAVVSMKLKEGDASGSAFIAKVAGKPTLITNAHVAEAGSEITFTLLGSKSIKHGSLAVSKSVDLAFVSQSEITNGFELMDNVESNVAVGDDIIVLGNSLGDMVATELKGKILGVGPDNIEIDAPFVHGNSGSPIIHVASGKVIGVATFLKSTPVDWTSKGTRFENVRRFGVRIDSAKEWDHPSWGKFFEDFSRVESVKRITSQLEIVAKDIAVDDTLDPGLYGDVDSELRDEVANLVRSYHTVQAKDDIAYARERFLRGISFFSKKDILYPPPVQTAWHKRRMKEALNERSALIELFRSWQNNQSTLRKMQIR